MARFYLSTSLHFSRFWPSQMSPPARAPTFFPPSSRRLLEQSRSTIPWRAFRESQASPPLGLRAMTLNLVRAMPLGQSNSLPNPLRPSLLRPFLRGPKIFPVFQGAHPPPVYVFFLLIGVPQFLPGLCLPRFLTSPWKEALAVSFPPPVFARQYDHFLEGPQSLFHGTGPTFRT